MRLLEKMPKRTPIKHIIKSGPGGIGLILDNNLAEMSLKDLQSLPFDFFLFAKLLLEKNNLDDRSFAILMTAHVESLFTVVLENTFVEMKEPLLNDLFKSEGGPLSTLHKKALIAYALGIIDDELLSVAKNIRAIRNIFAHSVAEIDFKRAAISRLCTKFETGDLDEKTEQNLLAAGHDNSTSRGRFFFGCRDVFGRLFKYNVALSGSLGKKTRSRAIKFSPDELKQTKQ